MLPPRSAFRRQSLHCLVTALILNGMLVSAAPPAWWSSGTPPVIDPTASVENHGVANIGQAKWVAMSAIETLYRIWPDLAYDIESDLVGEGKPIASWSAPTTQAEKDQQRAPLLLGQLKAIAAPFYKHLHLYSPLWLDAERDFYEMPDTGSEYPWESDVPADGSNKSPALIGQLKAVFSLDFTADRETGPAADGLPDLWEYRFFENLSAGAAGDPDDDGFTNVQEYANGTNPVQADVLDSDGDGISDQDEITHGTDPLVWDTDGDGVPDGMQHSSDGDSIPDALDAAKNDATVDWEKVPAWRYAVFMLPDNNGAAPIQANNQGGVLYPSNKLWTGSGWVNLPSSGANIANATARCIDDLGRIYGDGSVIVGTTSYSCRVSWPPGGGDPAAVMVGGVYVGSTEWSDSNLTSHMLVMTNSQTSVRHFIGSAYHFVNREGTVSFEPFSDPNGNSKTYRWNVEGDSAGQPVSFSFTEAPSGSVYMASNGEPVGYRYLPQGGSTPYVGNKDFYTTAPVVRPTPSGSYIAAMYFERPEILRNGTWAQTPELTSPVKDFSLGTAFMMEGGVWQNGRILLQDQMFPGNEPNTRFDYFHATPRGWLLGSRKSGLGDPLPFLGMPIHVGGQGTLVGPPAGEELDRGVDNVSATAKPGIGAQKALWIMAPIPGSGGESTPVCFRSPALASYPVTISGNGFTCSGSTVATSDQNLTFTGSGATSQDRTVDLSLGGMNALTSPLRVKTMKRRTVKVAVHPIGYKDANGSVMSPAHLPTKAALESYLNRVYGKQVNTFFTVDVKNQKDVYFDTDGNRDIEVDLGPGSELQKILGAAPGIPEANINIWATAGVRIKLRSKGYLGYKFGNEGVGTIILNGDGGALPGIDAAELVLNTVAHEIGHIMIGTGHPDETDSREGYGPARLQGTEALYPHRLMYSQPSAILGIQLVKAEWDKIEAWLKIEEGKGGL